MLPAHRPFASLRGRRLALTVVSAALAAALVGTSSPAGAGPLEDEQARAAEIAREREATIEAGERLNQRIQATEYELDQLARDEGALTAKLAASDQSLRQLRTQTASVVVNAYVHGTAATSLGVLLVGPDPNSEPVREAYTTVLYGNASDLIDRTRALVDDMNKAAVHLKQVINDKTSLTKSLVVDQRELKTKVDQLAASAAATDAHIAQLVVEEQDRLAREATAREALAAVQFTPAPSSRRQGSDAPATIAPPRKVAPSSTVAAPTPAKRQASTTTPTRPVAPTTTRASSPAPTARPGPTDPPVSTTSPPTTPPTTVPEPDPPPVSPGAATAVAEARRQLGKKYVFGAVGPDTFDCSGLTQYVWAKAGVSMPHYTGAQYAAFPKVSLRQLQGGDLVFLRADLGHMGIYIGGGQYIHAPRAGDVVKISTLAGNFVGAVRPG